MKVITMESSAYKEMMAQIANIAGYIREARDEKKRKRETEDKLLDTAQAAKMLNVSKRTMQRMRTDHRIEYVVVRGSCRYRLSEILRLLEDNTVRNEEGTIDTLFHNHTLLPGVKHIIAVASGKGGVGKSTVSANLAVALAAAGYRVGLLDADIFGPSQPKMFDVEAARPALEKVGDKELIIPIENYGVKMLSIGFFVNPDEAVLWRGAMACNALKQLISEANWGELDYLLIDLPPGTSDIHLTLVQTLALTGAVIVSTPQQVALADARKGISMFVDNKVNVPVLGLVENMAWFTPAELPENRYYIFGREGCKRLAEELGVPLLGQIPLVQSICESGDVGEPAALDEDTVTGMAFRQLAERVVERVAYREQHMAPTQKVEITHS